MRFKSRSLASTMFCSLIVFPDESGNKIIPICFVQMVWHIIVIKSMHISHRSLNNFKLLNRCRDIQESIYYLSYVFFIC